MPATAIVAAERHHGQYFVVDVDLEGRAQMLVRRVWQASQRIRAADTGAAGPIATPDTVEFVWRVAQFLYQRRLDDTSDEFRDEKELIQEVRRHERRAAELERAADEVLERLGHPAGDCVDNGVTAPEKTNSDHREQ